ncbi:hypothetical protein [Dyadobacter sp. CY343]|uniref:hypothetical protein n=1 Tax=Dyadobacter sp. CY343 TaxID=2907299 RepID=UPI001F191672|nr:hypothetical protein [Dyadobacter sp. CY343]MCE7061994.1 hypothetical protein [Dyadobacter sp. CY343]
MKRSILILSTLGAVIAACKEQEIKREDSPFITVTSPARNQSVDDTSTIFIKATIEPKNTSVIRYHVWLNNQQKKSILMERRECDCKGKDTVHVEESFKYDTNKTAELLLHVDATLEDGTEIREEVPFKLVDVKK